jgi:hypothetical protein
METGVDRPAGCLDDVTLASFLDGRLSGDDRARVEAHLAACAGCYRLFADSARFLDEEPAARRPALRLAAAALPVAAALIAGLLWLGRVPGPPPRSPAPRIASALQVAAETLEDGALRAAVPVELGAAMGFAPEQDESELLIGVHLADLELARRFGDPARADALADRLAQRLGLAPGTRSPWELRKAALAAGARPSRLRFGEWLETARLCAAARQARFFADARTRRALSARPAGLPEAAARELDRIKLPPATEVEWRELERALADAILLL